MNNQQNECMPVFHVLDTEILGMGLGAEVTYNNFYNTGQIGVSIAMIKSNMTHALLIHRLFPGNFSCSKAGDGKLEWSFLYVTALKRHVIHTPRYELLILLLHGNFSSCLQTYGHCEWWFISAGVHLGLCLVPLAAKNSVRLLISLLFF